MNINHRCLYIIGALTGFYGAVIMDEPVGIGIGHAVSGGKPRHRFAFALRGLFLDLIEGAFDLTGSNHSFIILIKLYALGFNKIIILPAACVARVNRKT